VGAPVGERLASFERPETDVEDIVGGLAHADVRMTFVYLNQMMARRGEVDLKLSSDDRLFICPHAGKPRGLVGARIFKLPTSCTPCRFNFNINQMG
jgi:hypothetical protein